MCHREIRTFELFIPVKRFVHLAFCYRLACLLLSCRLPTFTKRFLYRWRKFSSLFQPSVFYTFVFDFLVLEANGSEDIQSRGKTNGFSETLWANHSWKEVCIILPYLDSSIFFEFYNKFLFLRCFSVQVLVYTIIEIRQRRVATTAHSCFRVTHSFFFRGGGGGECSLMACSSVNCFAVS